MYDVCFLCRLLGSENGLQEVSTTRQASSSEICQQVVRSNGGRPLPQSSSPQPEGNVSNGWRFLPWKRKRGSSSQQDGTSSTAWHRSRPSRSGNNEFSRAYRYSKTPSIQAARFPSMAHMHIPFNLNEQAELPGFLREQLFSELCSVWELLLNQKHPVSYPVRSTSEPP
jgi:hypothetical protein